MKKIYIILFFLSCVFSVNAQENNISQKRQEDIEALKVAFISRELDLTPDEAQKFWPIYNQYAKELKATIREDIDDLDREEKVLNLRKRYREQFVKVLGNQRMKKMYGAENKFRQLLIKAIRQRRENQGNRPYLRRGQ